MTTTHNRPFFATGDPTLIRNASNFFDDSTIPTHNRPFFATVDPALIRNASNFFDNSTISILRELLQNSRRSGATEVRLSQEAGRWVYADNGPGCQPEELLGLGSSHWDAVVNDSETPAGCGFFSLARREPHVACPNQGWQVQLDEDHFNGKKQIVPQNYVGGSKGLTITFAQAKFENHRFEEIARFMPFDYYVDGKKRESKLDFLSGLTYRKGAIKRFNLSPHVVVEVALCGGRGSLAACYNGFVVGLGEGEHLTFGVCTGDVVGVSARVLVTRESELPLELPQRNGLVDSPQRAELLRLIYCAGLELAADHLQDESLASPEIWLNARKTHSYVGSVLYPKFAGRLVTRSGPHEMSCHEFEVDADGECFEDGRHITFDELEAGGYQMMPSKELLLLIAQTDIPATLDVDAKSASYDIDLDEYFAPGLRLVSPLGHYGSMRVPDTKAEGYEWAARARRLLRQCEKWCQSVVVCATGVTDSGQPLTFEGDADHQDFDTDNLYDAIRLEFRDEDDKPLVTLTSQALFAVAGDRHDSPRVDFLVTRRWFEAMPPGFPEDLAEEVYKIRSYGRAECSDEENLRGSLSEGLREAFAKFSGVAEFYAEKILSAACREFDRHIHNLDPRPHSVVVRMITRGNHVDWSASTCALIPEFVPCFIFEGSHGNKIACDAQGLRDPNSGNYPEFHAFDVESMRQIGLNEGPHHIVNACGWHDSTQRIYLTPAIPHLLWTVGLLDSPSLDTSSVEVRMAVREALRRGLISSALFSAWWEDRKAVIGAAAAGILDENLPPIAKLWVYEA